MLAEKAREETKDNTRDREKNPSRRKKKEAIRVLGGKTNPRQIGKERRRTRLFARSSSPKRLNPPKTLLKAPSSELGHGRICFSGGCAKNRFQITQFLTSNPYQVSSFF